MPFIVKLTVANGFAVIEGVGRVNDECHVDGAVAVVR